MSISHNPMQSNSSATSNRAHSRLEYQTAGIPPFRLTKFNHLYLQNIVNFCYLFTSHSFECQILTDIKVALIWTSFWSRTFPSRRSLFHSIKWRRVWEKELSLDWNIQICHDICLPNILHLPYLPCPLCAKRLQNPNYIREYIFHSLRTFNLVISSTCFWNSFIQTIGN